LHARVENLAAIAFYEKAGWTVTDRLIHTVEHGISYDERVLIKDPLVAVESPRDRAHDGLASGPSCVPVRVAASHRCRIVSFIRR
jgi:hypothetical protein